MKTNYKLSICIPTYNRGGYLDQLLKSIFYLNEAMNFEVIVSDNGSTDNTQAVINKYQAKYSNIFYSRNLSNIGPDANYLKSVSLATGEYCWLMGSDDIIIPESLKLIFEILNSNEYLTGISVNQLYLNSDISDAPEVVPFLNFNNNDPIIINNFNEIAKQISHYFGYLSGQIIKKSLWDKQISKGIYKLFLNSYVHVFIILEMVYDDPKWLVLPSRCVGYRSGNDSFLTSGILNRGVIDVVGYGQIYKYFFGKSIFSYNYCNTVILRKFVKGHLIRAKLANANYAQLIKFNSIVLQYNYLNLYYWLVILPVLVLPKEIIIIMRIIYRATFRKNKLVNPLDYADTVNSIKKSIET